MRYSDTIFESLLQSFCQLDSSQIQYLDDELIFSFDYKYEFIERLEKLFQLLKSSGISHLLAEPSTCKFCYPNGQAYEFYIPKTNELIFKYVFDVKEDNFIVVEECKNKPVTKNF